MPENGVVGSIAVNQVTRQLDLELKGNVVSESFPPVTTFGEGYVRDLVRVYAGTAPPIVVPQCDIPLFGDAIADLAAYIVHDLAADCERAIVLAGTSGVVVNDCYHADIPTITLVVKAHPFLPDPVAAKAVIEKALEPLVDFEIDTRALKEEADDIRQKMEQVAQYFEQLQTGGEPESSDDSLTYQ